MVGTKLDGNGGIATLIGVLNDDGFFDKWHVKHVPSHTQNHFFLGLNRQLLFAKCLFLIGYYHLFFKVGLVHVHTASRWSFLRKSIVVHWVKFLGGGVILHLHGGEFRSFYANECDQKKQDKIRRVFNKSDRVVVLSSQWLEWVKTIMNDSGNALVIPNAVSSLELDRTKADENLVLFLGLITQSKGVGDLIEAFSSIATEFPEAHMALAGDGDIATYQEQVRNLGLAERVEFLGWVAGQEKLELFQKAGIFVLPSYNEGLPMSVLEAMSAGIPIVASAVGGIPDAISTRDEGLLVSAGDPVALRLALRELLSSENLRCSLSANAQIRFQNNFSSEVVFPKWDELYQAVIDRK